jgi:hypothetical protein
MLYRIYFKVSEIVSQEAKPAKMFYTLQMVGSNQHHTGKQESIEQSEDQKVVYRFKEKFPFVMATGFEDVKIAVYGVQEQDEFEISHFKLKLPDYLVKLVD